MPIAKIDSTLCNGCGMCVDTCPEDVFRLDTQPIPQELLSPCATGCPAGMSVRKYSYYIEMGMMDEAYEALREYIPFPAITGRICPHFCESKCARKEVDEAVNINSLERYTADYFLEEKAKPSRIIYAAKIAVVGSGPAGLSCAYYLSKRGYRVTVFEKHAVLGGMLRLGIPDFHLPREIVDIQLDYLRDMGVEFKTGVELGKDITVEGLFEDYGAVFMALGTQLSKVAHIPGDENVEGLYGAFDFLRDKNLGNTYEIKDNIAVIGGGNVAMDAAMTLKRLGAKHVYCISLEKEDEMPAFEKEIRAAREDNVEIFAGYASKRIISENGKITGLDVIGCTRVNDLKGNFNPVFDENIKMHFDVEQIFFAVGQGVDASGIPEGVQVTAKKTIVADPLTLETSMKGVFAGGDIVRPEDGAVVRSFMAGRTAAESIDRYVRGVDLRDGRQDSKRVMKPPKEGIMTFPRQNPALGEAYDNNTARLEAQRCMTCGSRSVITYPEDCMVCLYCERDCPQKAITVTPDRPGRKIAPWDLS